MPPWVPSQVKVRCKLGIQRIRTLIEKNESLAKKARRDVASLLEQGKVETARIRTESLILQDTHNELYVIRTGLSAVHPLPSAEALHWGTTGTIRRLELLELYLELILARFGLLDVTGGKDRLPDPGISEAVSSIVFASPRTEIRELHIVREAFMHRYGREWSLSIIDSTTDDPAGVPERVRIKCETKTPERDWVDMYLFEVAKAYAVNWKPDGMIDLERDGVEDKDGESHTAAQDLRVLEASASRSSSGKRQEESAEDANTRDDEDSESGGDLALPTAPSSAPRLNHVRASTTRVPIIPASSSDSSDTQDNALPSAPPTDPEQLQRTVVIHSNLPASSVTISPEGREGDKRGQTRFDDLAKRFEALKRR